MVELQTCILDIKVAYKHHCTRKPLSPLLLLDLFFEVRRIVSYHNHAFQFQIGDAEEANGYLSFLFFDLTLSAQITPGAGSCTL